MSDRMDQRPIDILLEIADRVERIESLIEERQDFRLDIGTDTRFRSVAEHIQDHQPCTSGDLNGDIVNNATRALTSMYYAGYVNRNESPPYEYTLSETGKLALQQARADEQSELSDHEGTEEQSTDPWDATDLGRGKYIALRLVNEYDGHPLTGDIEEEYLDHGYESASEGCAVGARLSQLYSEDGEGYVDRPAEQPYRYWLTDKGRAVLADDTDA